MSEQLQLQQPAPKRERKFLGAGDVEKLARLHFAPPHYAFLTQVRNGTGYSRRTNRTADAIAMGTWPSRGLHLHGIEIKVSHSDFLAELKNPEKAEEIAQYCHFWWLIVSRPEVAPLSEVPLNWGLLVANADGDKLEVIRDAKMKDAKTPDHALLAAIMRRIAQDYVHKDTIKDFRDQCRVEAEKAADANAKYIREANAGALKSMQSKLEIVEKALGCSIHDWNAHGWALTFALAEKLRKNGMPIVTNLENLVRMVDALKPDIEKIGQQLSAGVKP